MTASPQSQARAGRPRPPLDLMPPPEGPVLDAPPDKTISSPTAPRLTSRRTGAIARGPVEVRGQDLEPAAPLDQEPEDTAEEEQAAPRARTRPLGFFAQEEDSPSFYLSLSDLMSLLLVFFVLIFSLTNPFAAPEDAARSSRPAARQEMPLQLPQIAPLEQPRPLPASVTRGLAAVAAAGPGDPDLLAEAAPARKTRRSAARATDAFLDRALLRLVTASKPVAPEAVIREEPRLSQLLAQMDAEVRAQTGPGVEVETRPDRVVVRLPEAITFDQGRAEIKPGMAAVLERLAEVLARRRGYQVVVTGHTDNLPIHNRDFASNWELSAARAAAVARALMAKGSAPGRFTIRGMADQQPIAPNTTPQGRQQNRRVEIELRPAG